MRSTRGNWIVFAGTLFLCSGSHAGNADCLTRLKPASNDMYSIRIDPFHVVRKLTPEFFGFNLEWVEFQLSLWDSNARRVNPDVVEWLRAFPGAVYRYPGGTVANYFDWKEASAVPASRKPQNAVSWRDALAVDFGPHEYLHFLDAVGGRPWYVLNLFGSMAGERPPADMAKGAEEIAALFKQESATGKPSVYRWELGNELDRDKFTWRPEKYADSANRVMSSVLAADKNAKFVVMSQDWNASKEKYGIDAITYNGVLGKAMQGKANEFASHHYYDGAPWGPPIPKQLRQHCQNLDAIERTGSISPSIWVTEHGRTPEGTPDDTNWKMNWPQTADLSAAISVADMVIALSLDPSVKGQFLHALHATDGPWPLFHRNKDQRIVPSAVYWGLRTLRDGMQEEVLSTQTSSANRSGYEGGYDLRAVAMAGTDRNKISIWLTNRAESAVQVALYLPSMTNASTNATLAILANTDQSLNNYGGFTRIRPRHENRQLAFDHNGKAILDVPANAVMSVSFSSSGAKK